MNVCVCFIGIDGSGKTRQATALSGNLKRVGIGSSCIRPEHLLLSFLPRSLIEWISQNFFARSKRKIGDLGNTNSKKNLTSALGKTVFNAWFISYAWLTHIIITRIRQRKNVVIYDRYFYDWAFHVNGNRLRSIVGLFPRPDVIFLLDLDVAKAFSRMHDETDKQFSLEYYSSLRNWYLALAQQHGFVIVDCTRDFEATSRAILTYLLYKLGGSNVTKQE